MILALGLIAISFVLLGGVEAVSRKQELTGSGVDGSEIPFPLVDGVLMKPNVAYTRIQPQTIHAIKVTKAILERFGVGPLVITSLEDGTHLPTSLHYKGLAFDARTRHMPLALSRDIAGAVRAELGDAYDVLNEGPGPGYDRQNAAAHIHEEFDP